MEEKEKIIEKDGKQYRVIEVIENKTKLQKAEEEFDKWNDYEYCKEQV